MVPSCISTSRFTKANPIPNPPCERSGDRWACVNRSKTWGRESGSDAEARIPHTQHRFVALLLDGEPDVTAFVGVLGGIGQQVRDDLLQPGGVGVQPNRVWRQRHREFMSALVDHRTSRLHRTFHDAAHGDLFLAKLNPAGDRARDVQQVTHQVRQLPHLTLNDGQGLLLNGVLAFLELKQLHGVEDGGKRVAKFMAKHGQKLVFTAVHFGQLLLRLFARGNVAHRGSAHGRTVSILRLGGPPTSPRKGRHLHAALADRTPAARPFQRVVCDAGSRCPDPRGG